MPKTVIHLFHDDDATLFAGPRVAGRVNETAADEGVELQVFCFGPALAALSSTEDRTAAYNEHIDQLTAAGVSVAACRNAAEQSGTAPTLLARGIELKFARDEYISYAKEHAAVISF